MLSTLIIATLLAQAPRPAAIPLHREAPVSVSVASHDRQLEIMARIKAEREAKAGNRTTQAPPKSPSDLSFRDRLAAKRAGYRAFQQRQDAAEAAQLKAMKAEQMRMMPYMLELNRQQTAAATARYQADQQLAGSKAIANGLKGVTAPPY